MENKEYVIFKYSDDNKLIGIDKLSYLSESAIQAYNKKAMKNMLEIKAQKKKQEELEQQEKERQKKQHELELIILTMNLIRTETIFSTGIDISEVNEEFKKYLANEENTLEENELFKKYYEIVSKHLN
jgi:hypothetical protein